MSDRNSPRRIALRNLSLPLGGLAALSFISNLLMLTGPIFMIQVYDRVLVSRSVPTLVVLIALVAVLFAFYGVIESMRSRISLRLGNVVDERLRGRLFRSSLRLRLSGFGLKSDPVLDADAVRNFASSSGVLSFLDLPWTPIYVAVVFIIHPNLGWLATAGVIIVAVFLVVTEVIGKKPAERAFEAEQIRRRRLNDAVAGAESAIAMGMLGTLEARWQGASERLRLEQTTLSDRSTSVSSLSKSVRFFLQSAVLALGAYIVIGGEMSPGSMIAASIVTSRALAPIEQVVANWKGFAAAREAWKRIVQVYEAPDLERRQTQLPHPKSSLKLSEAIISVPGSSKPLLAGLDFELKAGDALGIIGPSGTGKTSLLRTMVGAWPLSRGSCRLDGADLNHYEPEDRGDFIGYMPQRVELMSGSVAQNISRFGEVPSPDSIIDAAELADVQGLINTLADGYDTEIGEQGSNLSAGQRQRIGLARALFGRPFLVVLDEPSSNLDVDGEAALTKAILQLRTSGSIVIVVAHRPSALTAMSHVLVLGQGRQLAFGPKDEILEQANPIVAVR